MLIVFSPVKVWRGTTGRATLLSCGRYGGSSGVPAVTKPLHDWSCCQRRPVNKSNEAMNQWTKVDNNKNNNLLLPNHCMIEAVDNRHYRTLRTCKAQLGMVTTETNIFHNPTFVFKINVWIFWKYSHYKNSFRANYFEEVPKVLLVVWDGRRLWYQKIGMIILCFPQQSLL